MAKAQIIHTSFKRTGKDQELYKKMLEIEDKSHTIKEALWFYFNNKDKAPEVAIATQTQDNTLITLLLERLSQVVPQSSMVTDQSRAQVAAAVPEPVKEETRTEVKNAISHIIGLDDD